MNWDNEVNFFFKGQTFGQVDQELSQDGTKDNLIPASAKAKRIVGGSSDMNMLAPFKYKWAWQMYLDANANHWTPADISMGPDLAQFSKLTEAERHVYVNVLAYLTTSDIMVQRNIILAIYERITAPEIQQYLSRQAYEETLHSWTYQHCIEGMGLDQEDIYTRYKTVPEISGKINLCQLFTKSIIESDSLETFVYGLIFYYLGFEGGWFYHGFTPIFSLGFRNLMSATCEQLQYILRDESLHCAFGVRLIKEILKENEVNLDPVKIREIFNAVYEAEEQYINFILRDPILGYNKKDHLEHFAFVLNRRAKQIGVEPPFANVQSKYPWIDQIAGGIKQEGNFFEKRVKEYSLRALKWD